MGDSSQGVPTEVKVEAASADAKPEKDEGKRVAELVARAWPYRKVVAITAFAVTSLFATGYAGLNRLQSYEREQTDARARDDSLRKSIEALEVRVTKGEQVSQEHHTTIAVLNARLEIFGKTLDEVVHGVRMLLGDRIARAPDDKGKQEGARGGGR